MKKIHIALSALLLGIIFCVPTKIVLAAGGDWNTDMTASPTSALADGLTTITVNVHAYHYLCSTGPQGYPATSTDPNYCAANGYGTATVEGQNITGSPIRVTGSGNT